MSEDRNADDVFWVRPEMRGQLPIGRFHVPRSLSKRIKRDPFDIRVDTAFMQVMKGCAAPQPNRRQTWINGPILESYSELHEMGHAHSVEAWRDETLVGGLYGVAIGGAFFGESMFSVVTDASKVCLVYLAARLKAGGYLLHDTQFTTDHLRRFGAFDVPAADYARQLQAALAVQGEFGALPAQVSGISILQSITQTS